jgi:hypothetical protein
VKASRDARVEARLFDALAAWPLDASIDGEAPRWLLELGLSVEQRPLRVTARREDAWLLLEAPFARGTRMLSDAAALLSATAGLPGGVKLAAGPGATAAPEVRAELPVSDDESFGGLVSGALHGFARALEGDGAARSKGEVVATRPDGAGPLDSGSPVDTQLLRERCIAGFATAGFRVTDAPSGSEGNTRIDLLTARGFAQAVLVVDPAGATLRCELARCAPGDVDAAAALAHVGLRANRGLRLARATPLPDGGMDAEVWLGVDPGEALLRASVEALGVFADAVRQECELLTADPGLAAAYLRCHPTSPAKPGRAAVSRRRRSGRQDPRTIPAGA